ncbi:MAG: heavy-metal-associated domain-containing protein [Gemmata sp.]
MNTVRVKTDLRCGACVRSIGPLLNAEPGVVRWNADVSTPDKVLTVEGDGVTAGRVGEVLGKKGYRVLGELPTEVTLRPAATPEAGQTKASYYPLVLILLYLLGAVGLAEAVSGGFDGMRAMGRFMAGFFLVFSFFKLLNLSAFADSYAGYDVVAARWRAWGYAYPFVELALGAAYLTGFRPITTNVVTLLVMGVGTVGVVKSLLARRKIRCACLGTVFNLPMSYVTLVEDLLMVAMAARMLAAMAGTPPVVGH